ncbi:hypothetical protein AB0N14_37245 [Streptomyces sp. NPDC051104]|uniref:hypothetical protein n=1 Tax=Streptomyces sp. NPDC051104 TaxID=3155044 RepID=UPI00342A8FAB
MVALHFVLGSVVVDVSRLSLAAVTIGAVQVVAEAPQCQRPDPLDATALFGRRITGAADR